MSDKPKQEKAMAGARLREALEAVADIAEDMDNAWHATLIPMPAALHVQGLAASMRGNCDRLRAILAHYGAGDLMPDGEGAPPAVQS